ncbi:glycosyltransferase [Lysobacter sp. K5869]|uniref:glycosyltransferase n=1 Tax=Lysobacter sp. K5869 TaxID=2820808 RepID=UPI0021019EEA|nr:glycosyltransferase [Lysobacter sp. K5869]
MQRIDLLSERPSVCLVTEELPGVGGCGGIGAAFYELALLLAARGALVDVLFCPTAPLAAAEAERLRARLRERSIKLELLDVERHADGPPSHERRAYAVYRQLLAQRRYDFVHFHDYKGLGFFCVNAKKQGLAFAATALVVQLHGPTRWTIEANKTFFVHEDQLKIDHLEKVSIRHADYAVSPSAYLVDWLRGNGFELPPPERTLVLKNVCSQIVRELQSEGRDLREAGPATDLVLFARHEDRKGFAVFCDALDRVGEHLAKRNVRVGFMGKFGAVDSQPSGAYLIDRAQRWPFHCAIRTGFDRSAAAAYLSGLASPLVVVPSPFENSPYTVLEAAALGMPLICSRDGGGPELLEPDYPGLCEMEAGALAAKIVQAVDHGLAPARAAQSLGAIEDAWLEFHRQRSAAPVAAPRRRRPKVALAITHFERPAKLTDALISAARQTYPDLEILVVDDGSSSEAAQRALAQLEPFLDRLGGRLIRRENGYLGAARNSALAATDADYICFLDDDDYAFPNLIETLVEAALATDADAVNCLNVFMPETSRSELIAGLGGAQPKVCYVPIGGPLSVATFENCLGAATALLKTSSLRALGGYTELRGVGHEDYELFLRMAQAGLRLEVVAEPLYLYEVGRPSMLSRTSLSRNFRRCFDACALPPDGEAARDLLSLTLGKKVAVDAHNRLWWQYSLLQTADLRHQLMNPALSREEMLGLLVRLASAEGEPRLALAFGEDLRASAGASREKGEDDWVALHSVVAPPAAASGAPYDPGLADIKLEAELGRGEVALDKLIAFVHAAGPLAAEFYPVAFGVLRRSDVKLHQARYRQLSAALARKRVSRHQLTEGRVLMATLEYMLGRGAPVAALREIAAADEAAYLSMHADVARAVETGTVARGIEHYAAFGLREGRGGFNGIEKIASVLRDCDVEIEVEDLLDAVRG